MSVVGAIVARSRSQRDGADGNRREQGRMKLRSAMKTRALLTGIAALFLATGTAHAQTGCYYEFCSITGYCRQVCKTKDKSPLPKKFQEDDKPIDKPPLPKKFQGDEQPCKSCS